MLVVGLASQEQVILFFLLGTLGSLLPDMDADNSAPVQFTFSFTSILMAFFVMFFFAQVTLSVMELILIWLIAYLFFRWFIFALFTRFTRHRGIFHSIPAALFFGCLTATVAYRFFDSPPIHAWMYGIFVAFGYLVHLLLDELYSVNLFGMRTRRSLGTALKLYSRKSPPASIYLYLATIVVFIATPSTTHFMHIIGDGKTYHAIGDRLLPKDGWFSSSPDPATDTNDHR